MRRSAQDERYLGAEGDAFFERNSAGADPSALRPYKRRIAEEIEAAGVVPRRVLEFGCNYGDLLAHYARAAGAECVGVEASPRAVAFGEEAYGGAIRLLNGTLADNPLSRALASAEGSGAPEEPFDLVIVDDVLCWVSRETIFQSIAHVDDALADGGHLFLREFLPDRHRRNVNHHVTDGTVHCYKPAGPHYRMLTAAGTYAVVWQQVWVDRADAWGRGRDPFQSRWVDTILRKSLDGYFDEG